MSAETQIKEIVEIKKEFEVLIGQYPKRIIICAGTGCIANGSLKVEEAIRKQLIARGLPYSERVKKENKDNSILITKGGCQGFCQMGPLLTIEPQGILYVKVKAEDAEDIVEKTIIKGELIERLQYKEHGLVFHGHDDIGFYKKQSRFVLKNCGFIDPEDIREYIANGGYEAAKRAYIQMSQEEICEFVKSSKLRGRGGGGFPTGTKWDAARKQVSDKKYIICNGDEGDPGAFMNRSVLEGNPHSVLEGMMIGAKAIGADEGYVYVRAEYPLAVIRMRKAVDEAKAFGLLGENIFGSGKKLIIHVMEGAGAFVCGEETALMQSIEGKRGMPTSKPPFPAEKGLWGYPTVINNVETFAWVSLIFKNKEMFTSIGTPTSPGTKTFALTGHVLHAGLIEVPFGTTLRQIVFDIGGGVLNSKGELDNSAFKAVQIGGPSGACLSEQYLDLPLDFDSLTKIGAMVGSGGLVVMNKDTCMVQIARYFMQFTQHESCGKCVLCREGTKQMLNMLDDIINGEATEETLNILKQLANAVKKGSLCGLGKTAPNPVLSTFKMFEQEYIDHVIHKRCSTKQCKNLTTPSIDPVKCKGCTVCAKKCPVGAIEGERKEPHRINSEKCIKCGACITTCKFGAISGGN